MAVWSLGWGGLQQVERRASDALDRLWPVGEVAPTVAVVEVDRERVREVEEGAGVRVVWESEGAEALGLVPDADGVTRRLRGADGVERELRWLPPGAGLSVRVSGGGWPELPAEVETCVVSAGGEERVWTVWGPLSAGRALGLALESEAQGRGVRRGEGWVVGAWGALAFTLGWVWAYLAPRFVVGGLVLPGLVWVCVGWARCEGGVGFPPLVLSVSPLVGLVWGVQSLAWDRQRRAERLEGWARAQRSVSALQRPRWSPGGLGSLRALLDVPGLAWVDGSGGVAQAEGGSGWALSGEEAVWVQGVSLREGEVRRLQERGGRPGLWVARVGSCRLVGVRPPSRWWRERERLLRWVLPALERQQPRSEGRGVEAELSRLVWERELLERTLGRAPNPMLLTDALGAPWFMNRAFAERAPGGEGLVEVWARLVCVGEEEAGTTVARVLGSGIDEARYAGPSPEVPHEQWVLQRLELGVHGVGLLVSGRDVRQVSEARYAQQGVIDGLSQAVRRELARITLSVDLALARAPDDPLLAPVPGGLRQITERLAEAEASVGKPIELALSETTFAPEEVLRSALRAAEPLARARGVELRRGGQRLTSFARGNLELLRRALGGGLAAVLRGASGGAPVEVALVEEEAGVAFEVRCAEAEAPPTSGELSALESLVLQAGGEFRWEEGAEQRVLRLRWPRVGGA